MTKKLHSLPISHMTYADLAQFLTRFVEELDQSGIRLTTDEPLQGLVNQLKAQLPLLKKALEQVRASEKTQDLAKKDKARDEDLQALRDALKPYRVSKREPEQLAYTSLSLLLKQYKDTKGKNYEAQTVLVNALLAKLAVAPYKEQVSFLGLKRFVDNLAESNASFDQLYASRSKDKMTTVSYNTKEIRTQLIFTYNLLADYINVTAQVKKTKPYTDLLPLVNHSRKTYANILGRKTKSKKEKTGTIKEE